MKSVKSIEIGIYQKEAEKVKRKKKEKQNGKKEREGKWKGQSWEV